MMQSEHNHASVVLQLEWIGSLHATQVETLSAILTTVRLILLTEGLGPSITDGISIYTLTGLLRHRQRWEGLPPGADHLPSMRDHRRCDVTVCCGHFRLCLSTQLGPVSLVTMLSVNIRYESVVPR